MDDGLIRRLCVNAEMAALLHGTRELVRLDTNYGYLYRCRSFLPGSEPGNVTIFESSGSDFDPFQDQGGYVELGGPGVFMVENKREGMGGVGHSPTQDERDAAEGLNPDVKGWTHARIVTRLQIVESMIPFGTEFREHQELAVNEYKKYYR